MGRKVVPSEVSDFVLHIENLDSVSFKRWHYVPVACYMMMNVDSVVSQENLLSLCHTNIQLQL